MIRRVAEVALRVALRAGRSDRDIDLLKPLQMLCRRRGGGGGPSEVAAVSSNDGADGH